MKKNNQIALTGMFLALTTLFEIIQIPVVSFLNLDFSILIILISISFLEFKYVSIVSIFSPLFLLLFRTGDVVGVSFLIVANLLVSFSFWLTINKRKEITIPGYLTYSLLLVIVISFILTFLNIVIFTPAYYGFDYSVVFENIIWFFSVLLPFNLLKFSLIFILYGFYYFIFLRKNIISNR